MLKLKSVVELLKYLKRSRKHFEPNLTAVEMILTDDEVNLQVSNFKRTT